MAFKDWNINDLAISLNAIPLDACAIHAAG